MYDFVEVFVVDGVLWLVLWIDGGMSVNGWMV